MTREAPAEDGHAARVYVQADRARGQMAEVEAGSATCVEDPAVEWPESRDQSADGQGPIAMEESLKTSEVVGNVDPVVGFDVPIVVLDPLRPGDAPGFKIETGRSMGVSHPR